MGEARNKRNRIAKGACACGSQKIADECCFLNGTWHKRPSAISLGSVDCRKANDGCYLRDYGSCSTKLSREHLVSEAVLRVIKKEGLVVSGFPWMNGEKREIGIANLVAKCLCKSHNSALSDLDAAAANLFSAIEAGDVGRSGPPIHRLVSGHDIERWFLKTLLAFAHSRNLAQNGKPLLPVFHSKIDVADMLQDPSTWPEGSGLYFMHRVGDEFRRGDHFEFAPLTLSSTGEIVGMLAKVQGLSFSFFAVPLDDSEKMKTVGTLHRPRKLLFKFKNKTNVVELSWEDNRLHGRVEMDFAST
ncbi:MAG: hypothetical protein RH982_04540 [Parvibaculum sp.]